MPRRRKRKIMSVDELYSFCLKNNFLHFSSNESGKELMVRMNGNFEKESENEDKHKEGLTPFVSRAFHDHVNLNMSEISEESFNENVPSANFRPILAHITTNSDNELDFGSHDYYVTSDKDGNDKVVYEEQPIGVIDGSKTSVEYDEDAKVNRAVLHGYLYDEYCQDAIDILNRRGTVDCSIELSIRELSFNAKNGTLVLEDFYVSGLTLLSKDVNPGMAGSNFKIEDFTVDKNAIKTFSNDKLVETLEKLTSILEGFDIKENYTKGGTELNKENFEEEVTTEEVTDTEESKEEVTNLEEESEETVEESSTDNSEPESSEDGDTDGDVTEQFENMVRTFEVSHEDIKYALYNLLSAVEENDNDWYYITNVYDSYFVYENWDGGKIYGQKYTVDNDVVTFDGERYVLIKEYLTEEEYAELQTMRVNYSSITEKLAKYEEAEELADKITIFDDEDYADCLETEEFKSLMSKETLKKYSKEELKEKADAAFGRICKAKKKTTFAADNNVNVTKKRKNSVAIFTDADSAEDSIYGDYFKSTH